MRCMVVATLAGLACYAPGASASYLVPQTALPGDCILQFAVPLPVFGPAGPIPRVNAAANPNLQVTLREIDQAVLPQGASDTCGLGVTFGPTRVWAYQTNNAVTGALLGPANWPAVTLEITRNVSTTITYVNQLPAYLAPIATPPTNSAPGVPSAGTGLVQGLVTVDQSLHWADPLQNSGMKNCPAPITTGNTPCGVPFGGSPPATAHLHGGEVPSQSDGGPDSWFTSDGLTGPGYSTVGAPAPGTATYWYPNSQEPGTDWVHDHALGATRTNVYGGMAAFYFIEDPTVAPKNLPSGPYQIEMAIQDRQFDTNSQLYFPDGSDPGCGDSEETPLPHA